MLRLPSRPMALLRCARRKQRSPRTFLSTWCPASQHLHLLANQVWIQERSERTWNWKIWKNWRICQGKCLLLRILSPLSDFPPWSLRSWSCQSTNLAIPIPNEIALITHPAVRKSPVFSWENSRHFDWAMFNSINSELLVTTGSWIYLFWPSVYWWWFCPASKGRSQRSSNAANGKTNARRVWQLCTEERSSQRSTRRQRRQEGNTDTQIIWWYGYKTI